MALNSTFAVLSMATIVTNRFADETDQDFAVTLDNLRLELAPTTIMESVWVEMALLALKRLRVSALDETEDSANDPRWLRFQSMAERSLNNAMTRLERGRRQAARTARAAPAPSRSTHLPTPASTSETTPKPQQPNPKATEESRTTPTPATALDTQKAQFARVRQAAAETSTMEELMNAIDPTIRNEFLEQFRDDVSDMLSEGYTPEELTLSFPALTLADVLAFQAGAPLPLPTTQPALTGGS